jgi:hypothetical protein
MKASVRLANKADLPKLQQLDSWPKEHIWQQKIYCHEVIILELEEVIGLIRTD